MAQRSNIGFTLMAAIGLPIRNMFMPPHKIWAEVELNPGAHVLDFGCGPGTFTLRAAENVGPAGVVYALDLHPLALKTIEKKAAHKQLTNVRTIHSACSTALPDEHLDAVIFFDVFHLLDNQADVLAELHRVLKPDAIMYFSDHHMQAEQIIAGVTEKRLFRFERNGYMTFRFRRV